MSPTPTPRRRRPSPRPAACVAVALALSLAACGGGPPSGAAVPTGPGSAEEEAVAVAVAPVVRQAISSLYSTSATLRAERQATVTARTRGVVRALEAEEGDRVAAGAVLAHLEDDEQRIAAARARVAHDTSRRELARLEGLFGQGLASEEAFEKARRSAEDARIELELAELVVSRTTIRAPFAGVVVRRHLDLGAAVADGTALFDLADVEPLFADLSVPERHVARLGVGQAVRLSTGEGSAASDARIERIAPAVEPSTGTVKVTVAVAGGAALRPGAFVRVDVVTDTHADALVVARSALVAEGRRWHLFRLAGDGTSVAMLEATLGFENGDSVEVASATGDGPPLAAGDRVVVAGAPALSDGVRVRVVEPAPAAPAAANP